MGETTGHATPQFDELRQRFREVTAAREMSISEAARRAGVAPSTLAAWAAGKYAGDNGRVAKDVEVWLRSLDDERIARLGAPSLPTFVDTPSAQAFTAVLSHAQYVPDLVVITGGAGVGKTTAARRYRAEKPNVWMMTGEPSMASSHAMLEYMCDVLGVDEPSPSRRSRAIVRKIISTQGLVIVDEAQHLTTPALEQLRAIHDKAAIGFALLGNAEVYSRLDGGGRKAQFAQLFSRVGMRLARARPLAKDVETLLDAAGVTGAAERKMLRGVAASPGALRSMSKVLRVANMLAADEGGTLDQRHLAEAWARLSDNAQIAEVA